MNTIQLIGTDLECAGTGTATSFTCGRTEREHNNSAESLTSCGDVTVL